MAFRVKDAKYAFERALSLGAEGFASPVGEGELKIPAIIGIGGSLLYFVDRYTDSTIYDVDFLPLPGVNQHPVGLGLIEIDHLTHNVFKGRMDHWANFYVKLFNFREQRYFDISGAKTGLLSRAMIAPCSKIRIPINESRDDKSQIAEYLDLYKGEGIQHIALTTEKIIQSVNDMAVQNIPFMTVPKTYYKVVDERLPNSGLPLEELSKHHILIDGEIDGARKDLLLQIFTKTVIGPIFFEVIQRLGHQGFGEGNFTALFEALERDQMERGVL
jgi:4-hydroxyphenylpyruvate dioxygenase